MYPSRFDYLKVDSFAAASAALLSGGAGAKLLAGGQTLIPMLKLRLLSPDLIIDLGGITGAEDIIASERAIEIAALARHAEVGKSKVLRRFPIISDCALGIADSQVRNMGTIGGSLAEADPCSCWPALLVALDGEVLLEGPAGRRAIGVRELLADAFAPNLGDGELITRVAISRESLDGVGAFVAFKRAAPAYPTASCALQVAFEGDRIGSIRMGFGCLALTPLAFDEASELAVGRVPTKSLINDVAQAAAEYVEPIDDNKGSAAYKRSLAAGLVIRAFEVVTARHNGTTGPATHSYYG
jgi:aerobic carbon-monoxide dehydrogenase medium subunit